MTPTHAAFERPGGEPWDVVVIGAGPAGALLARQVAREGRRGLLLDRREFPRPKVCGACLNGKALGVLSAVGLGSLVDRLGGSPLDRFEVHLGGRLARFALPGGQALARDVLDAALVDEAIKAGATWLPGATARVGSIIGSTRAVRLTHAGRSTQVEARVVVAAAGLGGTCLDDVPSITTREASGARVGAGCVVSDVGCSIDASTIVMAVGRGGYVGLVRLSGGRINVAAALDRPFLRAQGSPARAAAALLDEAGLPPIAALDTAAWQGTVTLTRATRPVASHRLFLVGDAAGYVEPFTGEGMGAALLSAQLAAPLAAQGASAWDDGLARRWIQLHRRHVARPQAVIRTLAAAARRPWAARAVLALAARSSMISTRVIQRIHTFPQPLEVT